MSWPTPQEYNEAIQNPQSCFSDPELQSGQPTLTPLLLPRPISGAFASVYQMNCGARKWAVRCFLREFADQQQRYLKISDHFEKSRLPFLVGFQFVREGIKIRGSWYPILKMEWVDGVPFNVFIEQNLKSPNALHSLTRQWLDILSSLRQAGIAHGDLQHGNILVSQGKIKLIDYDGMYVPGLAGLVSHEEGHRNYQHPARTGKDFGPHLDSFSGWVILVTLSALAVQPGLWRDLNGGDECLLFRHDDFKIPTQSKSFKAIGSCQSPEVKFLATSLRSFLALPLAQIPSADAAGKSNAPLPSALPEWVKDSVLKKAVSETPSWLIEQLVGTLPPVSIWQGMPFLVERAALLCGVSLVVVAFAICIAGLVTIWEVLFLAIIVVGIEVGILRFTFKNLPLHFSWQNAQSDLARSKENIAKMERQLEILQNEISRSNEVLMELNRRCQELPTRHQIAENDLFQRRNAAIAENDRSAKVLNSNEAEAIIKLDQQLHREVTALSQQVAQFDVRIKEEFAETLKVVRETFIVEQLRHRSISLAAIHGIGETLKARLQNAGIQSADDVDYSRVRNVNGIGDAKARMISGWAKKIRQEAETYAPAELSPETIQRINAKYDTAWHSVVSQIETVKGRIAAEKQTVMSQFASKRNELVIKRAAIGPDCEKEIRLLKEQVEKERNELDSRKKLLQEASEARKTREKAQQDMSRGLFQARVDQCKQEREIMRYATLKFKEYFWQIVRFKWPGRRKTNIPVKSQP